MMLMVAAFVFLLYLPERKKSKQRQEQLNSIKKNDKVVTISGIHGVVVNPKVGDDEIVLRVDEDKDVKIKFSRSAIQSVNPSKDAS